MTRSRKLLSELRLVIRAGFCSARERCGEITGLLARCCVTFSGVVEVVAFVVELSEREREGGRGLDGHLRAVIVEGVSLCVCVCVCFLFACGLIVGDVGCKRVEFFFGWVGRGGDVAGGGKKVVEDEGRDGMSGTTLSGNEGVPLRKKVGAFFFCGGGGLVSRKFGFCWLWC